MTVSDQREESGMSYDRIEFVRGYCAERAAAVAREVGANELETATIERFAQLVLHGSKFIDLHVRVDGREYHFEADWLARLFRPPPAQGTEAGTAETATQIGGSVHDGPVAESDAPTGEA